MSDDRDTGKEMDQDMAGGRRGRGDGIEEGRCRMEIMRRDEEEIEERRSERPIEKDRERENDNKRERQRTEREKERER